jgi:hypothetical protein
LDEINYPHHLSFLATAKKKPIPEVTITPRSKTNRKIVKIRDIDFSSDSLLLSFYDNGTIDGDTVTVSLNGKILVEKTRLKPMHLE